VRRSGLPLEAFPAFLQHALRVQPAAFQAARQAGDMPRCGAILEETLVGYSLRRARDVMKALNDDPQEVEAVRIAKREMRDERAVVDFELTRRGRKETQRWILGKQGNGWVILELYVAPAKTTIAYMRTFVTVVELHKMERGAYPTGSIEELQRLFESLNFGKVESVDSWGTPFRYVVDESGTSYTLASAGADRTFKPETWNVESRSSDPAEDIVARDGAFVKMWTEPR
jgi:hypothetical protein